MLVDRYGRRINYLRISVTDRCNLRCVYCMPAEGAEVFESAEILSYEDLHRVVGVAVDLGITRFRFTGGEPLVRRELTSFLARLKPAYPKIESLSLTTNGLLLARHAEALKAAGVDKLNVSLDSFRHEVFARLARLDALDAVLEGLAAATRVGIPVIKVNAVLLRGFNDDELEDFVAWTDRMPYHVRFIEFMPYGEWKDRHDAVVPVAEVVERIERAGCVPDRGPDGNGPARYWRRPGAPGTVGVISPVTNKFCENCNRIRLNARGELRGCLLDEGMVSLKEAVAAGDDAVAAVFRRAIREKPEKHYDLRTFHMSTIGG
ncbi:MAG TPA: GTP 3',8-cyclase MoaA [Planctomycetota bacterium]|nr:GTP 3',8-cyclase MoaA [Planctomycetota bacterium]